MPRTQIPIDTTNDSGVVFIADTVADTTNGNYFINSGKELLFVENTGASSVTVTLDYVADSYGRDGTKVITVAASTTKVIGPFTKDLYNHPGEQVYINASATCDYCVVKP